jgi:YesN/AraC family two-component response regulator
MISVLIADDQHLIRKGLRMLLEAALREVSPPSAGL